VVRAGAGGGMYPGDLAGYKPSELTAEILVVIVRNIDNDTFGQIVEASLKRKAPFLDVCRCNIYGSFFDSREAKDDDHGAWARDVGKTGKFPSWQSFILCGSFRIQAIQALSMRNLSTYTSPPGAKNIFRAAVKPSFLP
jgi:hypothetical protein